MRASLQLVWLGFGAFFVTSLAVGLRLVALWWRTRRAPELLIGLGVLGIGPVGFGLQACAVALWRYPQAEALATAGAAAGAVGLWAKLVFNWSVYRRGSRFAAVALFLLCAGVAAQLLVQPFLGSFLDAARDLEMTALRGGLQVLALGWGAAEALLYWVRMRRRLRLGLADPVVTNRFLLWGLSAAAAGLGTAIGVGYLLATGISPLESPEILASSSAHGFVAAVGMWLAFVPPRPYVRLVAGRRAAA